MKLKNWSQTVNLISLIIILMISRVKNDPKLNRLSYNCKEEEQSKFENCQADAEYDWDIRDVDQVSGINESLLFTIYSSQTKCLIFFFLNKFSGSRKFCCSVWDVLKCRIDAIERCNPNYASRLASETEQAYGAMCDYYSRNSAFCILRWWSLFLIIVAIIALIVLMIVIFRLKKQSKFQREYATCSNGY